MEYTDAWGVVLSTSGTLAGTLGNDNPFRYRGYYYDAEIELYYLQSRYYSPEWGRFINADDIDEINGSNLFAYCINNPTNLYDPNGRAWVVSDNNGRIVTAGNSSAIKVISGNRYLSMNEMKTNAQIILDYLRKKGWTKNAVCGMLGNMQSESSINPGIWQSLNSTNKNGGFGLVQWTPSTKYTEWAIQNKLVQNDIFNQLQRILYEVTNNIQWINKQMTFQAFTKSYDTAKNLGMLFLNSYERPTNRNQPNRGTQAEYWFNKLI